MASIDVGYTPRKDPRTTLPMALTIFSIVSVATYVALTFWAPIHMDSAFWNQVQVPLSRLDLDLRAMMRVLASFGVAGLSAWVVRVASLSRLPLREPFRQLNNNQPRVFYDSDARDDLRRRLWAEAGSSAASGLYLAPHLALPRAAELKNILLVGAPNSGKSNIARALADQAIEREDRVLLLCNKGDITQSFTPDEAILIAAHHADSHAWDMAADITDPAAAMQLASDIVPASTPPFWSDCARAILSDLVQTLIRDRGRDWNARHLLTLVSQDSNVLRETMASLDLSASPLLNSSDPDEDDRTVSGILLTMRSAALTNLRPLAWAWSDLGPERRFSLRRWLSPDYQGPRTVIVQFSPDYEVLSTLVAGGLIQRTATLLADPRVAIDHNRRVVLVLDEFNILNRVDRLAAALAVGREKGLMAILGIQSVSQVISTYGSDLANVLFDLFQIKIYGRLIPGEAALMVSRWIGQRDVSALLENRTPDKKDERINVEKVSTEDVFEAGRLAGDLGVFANDADTGDVRGLIHAFGQCYRVDWPFTTWAKRRDGFVPAPWLAQMPPPPKPGTSAR